MCYDGKNIPEQIPKMVFPLSCYYLTLAPLQFNKRCSEILDCLFRNTEPKKKKKKRENITLQTDLITPKVEVQWSQCACNTHWRRRAIECSWWWRCNITIKASERRDWNSVHPFSLRLLEGLSKDSLQSKGNAADPEVLFQKNDFHVASKWHSVCVCINVVFNVVFSPASLWC